MGAESRDINSDVASHHIGPRLVRAGVISSEERDLIVQQQKTIKKEDLKWMRFGDIAIIKGFCTRKEIESLEDFIGEKLVKAGIISRQQQISLVNWQNSLRERGTNVLFGELAVSEGFCEQEDINGFFDKTTH